MKKILLTLAIAGLCLGTAAAQSADCTKAKATDCQTKTKAETVAVQEKACASKQATLAAGVDGRKAGDRFRHLLAVGADDAQAAGAFGDEHLAVRQERHAPRVDEPFGDGDDLEGHIGLLLGRARLPGECRLLIRRVRWTRVQSVLGPSAGRATAAPAAGRGTGRRTCWWSTGLLSGHIQRGAEGKRNCHRKHSVHHQISVCTNRMIMSREGIAGPRPG